MNVLLIDNRDSFTFNLADACKRLGAHVATVRNEIAADEAMARAEDMGATVVISPGPGRPEDAGCCIELIALARGRNPILGICLGHQAIVLEAGGDVDRAGEIAHGKSSLITHDERGPFEGLPNPMRVGRYHSLCTKNPPRRFTVHARLDEMAMAISDADALQVGLQFHPESILTPLGDEILGKSLAWLGSLHA